MYLSTNYICFHANILNWKSTLIIKLQDIVLISREKTAKLISNAIEIKTIKAEKHFFASFLTRDKTFGLMVKLWQAALDNQVRSFLFFQMKNENFFFKPLSSEQFWSLIHENYGEDLDMTTDEDDHHHQNSKNSRKKQENKINPKYDVSLIDDGTKPSVSNRTFTKNEVSVF